MCVLKGEKSLDERSTVNNDDNDNEKHPKDINSQITNNRERNFTGNPRERKTQSIPAQANEASHEIQSKLGPPHRQSFYFRVQ